VIELDSDIKQKMAGLKRAMAEASDGKVLKRQLSKRLRGLVAPLVAEQKARVLRLPSKGHDGPGLRQAIARQTKAATRWSGKNMGVQIIQRGRSMPRDFRLAGRAFNREAGWHPKTLGGETVLQQIRPAQWFDQPVKGKRSQVAREVHTALEEAAAKIGQSAHI
jgi:hypothetical protein